MLAGHSLPSPYFMRLACYLQGTADKSKLLLIPEKEIQLSHHNVDLHACAKRDDCKVIGSTTGILRLQNMADRFSNH